MTIVIAQLILRVKIPFTFVIFVLLFNLKANRRNLLVQICLNLMILDRDYHIGIIMRKSFKTKYRLKYAVFDSIIEPAVSSNQQTQSQEGDVIIDSCQRTRTLHSNSVTQKDPNIHDTYTHFRHSAQSTPPPPKVFRTPKGSKETLLFEKPPGTLIKT